MNENSQENGSVMVVGGGIAGMTAALSIADQGFDVHLVEKRDSFGGNIVNVKKTVEGYDPAVLLKNTEQRIATH